MSSVDHFDPIRRETFIGVKILGALGDRMYYWGTYFSRRNPSTFFKKDKKFTFEIELFSVSDQDILVRVIKILMYMVKRVFHKYENNT
jgi:hypothetical protein